MKIYLSGPMEGHKDYAEKFATAAEYFRKRGHTVFNPAEKKSPEWTGWQDAKWESLNEKSQELSQPQRRIWLRDDIVALSLCNAIVMLQGWEKSLGAMAEYAWANAVRMPCFDYGLVVLINEGFNDSNTTGGATV